MKRLFFRFLACFVPVRKWRDGVRSLGVDYNNLMLNELISDTHALADISKIAPARGWMNLLQKTNRKLLIALDLFCKEKHIEWCLIGGAIIGKIRHNGFIPWDDDLDIAVIDKDWDKLVYELVHSNFNKDCCLIFGTAWNLIKIHHKPTNTFIDIFRFSYLDTDVNIKNYETYLNRKILHAQRHKESRLSTSDPSAYIKINAGDSIEVREQKLNKIKQVVAQEVKLFNEIVLDGKPSNDNCGLAHFSAISRASEVFQRNIIFPITRINFEGYDFPFPHNIEDYAFVVWGDIWKLPSNFNKHDRVMPTYKQYFSMRNLVDMFDQDVYKYIFGQCGEKQ